MGLFNRGNKQSSGVDRGGPLPPAPPVSIETLAQSSPPDPEAARDLPNAVTQDVDPRIWEAVNAAIRGDVSAESQLQGFANGSGATAWVARMELGTLLMEHTDQRLDQAIGLLWSCLQSPFVDLIGTAAWNLSEILWHHDKEEWFGFAAVAAGLENPLAMVVLAERADATDAEVADDWINNAREAIPRLNAERSRVEILAARRYLATADGNLREWFETASVAIPQQLWSEYVSVYVNDGLLYNVEAGSASVATRYFPECPEDCYFDSIPHDCSSCGRNRTNFLSCAAGQGDGAYYTLSLLGSNETIGAMTLFKDAVEDLGSQSYDSPDGPMDGSRVGPGEALGYLLAGSAPLVLGHLQTDGSLLFSDSSKCQDDRDFTVRRESEPGRHTVVCWASIPLEGDANIRPLALAAIRGAFASAIEDCLPRIDDSVRATLIQHMWGSGDMLVHSHFADVRAAIVENNIENEADSDLGMSWILQYAEFYNDEGTEVLNDTTLSEQRMRELLQFRGILNPQFPWMTPQGKANANLTRQSALRESPEKLTKRQDIEDGVRVGLELARDSGIDSDIIEQAEEGNILALNNIGHILLNEAKRTEGLPLLEQSALGGLPWAVSNYSWYHLFTGQYDAARDLFDRSEQACKQFVFQLSTQGDAGVEVTQQWINAQSNDALCRLALGDSYAHALEVWSAGRWHDHTESKFFPALVAWKQDEMDEALRIVADLSPSTLTEIRETLEDGAANAVGWFVDWCREGLDLLDAAAANKSQDPFGTGPKGPRLSDPQGATPGSVKFCIFCGTSLPAGANFCGGCGKGIQ